jgi:hypothetical protein
MLKCKHGRYPLGPAASPGVRGSAPVLRPMSTQAALPLLVSVGRPGPPKPGGVKGGPAGPSAADLYTAGYAFDPTDGGRDLHWHDLRS